MRSNPLDKRWKFEHAIKERLFATLRFVTIPIAEASQLLRALVQHVLSLCCHLTAISVT